MNAIMIFARLFTFIRKDVLHRYRYSDELIAASIEVDRRISEEYDPREDPGSPYYNGQMQSRNPKPSGVDYGENKYVLVEGPQYLRGRERMAEMGANLFELDYVIKTLLNGNRLPRNNRQHKLGGKLRGRWECHIRDSHMGDDWVLIYAHDHRKLVLYAIDTGTHKDCGIE